MSVEPKKDAQVAPLAPHRRSARSRRSKWPVRVAILLALVLGGILAAQALKPKPLEVQTVKVERGTVRDEISSSTAGEVMPLRDATVRAEIGGRVLKVRHPRGDRVKQGETVLSLDAADLDARRKQAAATLEAQRAQVAQADARAEAARRTADRARRLAEHGAETQQVADDSAAQAREAEAGARAARAQLDQAQAALETARVARSKADLTAPFDGLLAEVEPEAGDELPAGAVVFRIIDDSQLHVEATIDEADIARVKVGQPAVLRLDALPDHPIDGAVSKVDPAVRRDEKGARTLRIEVAVANLEAARALGIRPGMSANADVRVAEKQNVLNVPTNVIIGRGTKRTVYRVENGVARERQIQVGLSNWDRTEIVAGLAEGDPVVASLNTKGLADGVAVSSAGQAKR